jgi:cell division septation protein DedD
MAAAAEDGDAAAAAASLEQSSVGKPKTEWPTTRWPQTETKREAAVRKKKKSSPDDCWHGRFCKTLKCVFSHPDGRCLDQG